MSALSEEVLDAVLNDGKLEPFIAGTYRRPLKEARAIVNRLKAMRERDRREMADRMADAMVGMLRMKLEDVESGKAQVISVTGDADDSVHFHIGWVKT